MPEIHGSMKRILNIVGIGVTIASLGAVGWFAYKAAQSGVSLDDVRWIPFGSAVVLQIIVLLLLPVLWERILNFLLVTPNGESGKPDRLEMYKSYSRSWLARYIPGRVWMFGGRAALAFQLGIPMKPITRSMFLEVLFSYSMIGIIGASLMLMRYAHVLIGLIAAILATMSLVAVFYVLQLRLSSGGGPQGPLMQRVQIYARKVVFGDRPLTLGQTAWGFGVYGLHACLQLGFIVLLAVSFVDLSFNQVLVIAGGWALSVALGYLAFFAPGGLGVRDGFGLVFFSLALDVPTAGLIVGMSRFVMLLADVAFVALLEVSNLWLRAQQSKAYRAIET